MWTRSTPLETKKNPTRRWVGCGQQTMFTDVHMCTQFVSVEPVRFERTSIAVPPCGFRRDVEPVTAPGQKVSVGVDVGFFA